MKIRSVLTGIVVVSVALLGSAPASGDRMGYYALLDKFFALVQEGKANEAIDAIYATNPYADKIADQIASLKVQFAGSTVTTGRYHTHELLIEKEIAGRYAYVYVFVAYARQPMRMEFHFYRPQEQWVLQQFSYSDDINDDIATFAKYDLIR